MSSGHESPEPEKEFVSIPMVILIIGMLMALLYLNEKKLDKTELVRHNELMDHQYTEIQNDIRDIRNVLLIPRKP